MEAYTFVKLTKELGYLEDPIFKQIVSDLKNLLLSVNGYISFLKRSKRGANDPGAPSSIKEPTISYEVNDDLDTLFDVQS